MQVGKIVFLVYKPEWVLTLANLSWGDVYQDSMGHVIIILISNQGYFYMQTWLSKSCMSRA